MSKGEFFDRARALGIPDPVYPERAQPELWLSWREHVLCAEKLSANGGDPKPIIREACFLAGRPVDPAVSDYPNRILDLDQFRQLRSMLQAYAEIRPAPQRPGRRD